MDQLTRDTRNNKIESSHICIKKGGQYKWGEKECNAMQSKREKNCSITSTHAALIEINYYLFMYDLYH